MKLNNLLGLPLLLFSGTMITSCSDQDMVATLPGNGKPMELTGSIEQVYQTRASDFGFTNGDCMGVYVVDYVKDTPGTLEVSGNRATNYAMTFDAATGLWSGNTVIYWKDDVTSVDVYGYYPYESSVTSIEEYPFTVAADQSEAHEGEMSAYEASDFLWAKATNATPAQGKINLTYKHRMAGVKVTLAKGSGFTETEWQKLPRIVTVDNTLRNATINLASGMATPTGEFDRHITMSAESADTYRAVVVPQMVVAGKSVIGVTIDGVSYPLVKNADLTYNPGKLHHFTITVNKREGGDYELSITSEDITPWENDESSHFMALYAYVTVHVEKEGELETCLEEKGCDINTLQNLKITGSLTDADFVFIREKLPVLRYLNLRETQMKHVFVDEDVFTDNMFPTNALSGKSSLRTVILSESINRIGYGSLSGTNLYGVLTIPNSVRRIDGTAFSYTDAPALELILPDSLEYIGDGAFAHSNYKCEFKSPNTLKYIGGSAFLEAGGFYGHFRLPDHLEYLGDRAFCGLGHDMTGDIVIPSFMTEIPEETFRGIGFANGTTLTFHDGVTKIGTNAFVSTRFKSPITLPASLLTVDPAAFTYCSFTGGITFPKNLSHLGNRCFGDAWGLTGELRLPENMEFLDASVFRGQGFTSVVLSDRMTALGDNSLDGLAEVKTITLGKNLEFIGRTALTGYPNLQTMICLNPIPPELDADNLNGIYYDKAILEVPEESVDLYRNTSGWNKFKNITAHKELAYNVPTFECLNTGGSRTGVLRCQSAWEVIEKPDWCDVLPMSGNGEERKEEVTISMHPLAQGDGQREGIIKFRLKDTDYTTYTTVRQYDYEYSEDSQIVLQDASVPGANPVQILIVGEGFTAHSIADGSYLERMRQQMEHFFGVEPYRTYREYFKVSTAIALSPDKGVIMAGVETSENKFNTYIDCYGLHINMQKVMDYAELITRTRDLNILIIGNMNGFMSQTFRDYYWENRRVSFCTITEDTYPYDQRGLIQHEFGGHNFADLGDENVEHFEFIRACSCPGCNALGRFNEAKQFGGFANLSLTGSVNTVPWKHLIFDPRYSDIVDVYEGGHRHARGVYRSEIKTCMGTYIPYYSTIAREEIVRRIMKSAGLPFDFEAFVSKDSREGRPTEE